MSRERESRVESREDNICLCVDAGLPCVKIVSSKFQFFKYFFVVFFSFLILFCVEYKKVIDINLASCFVLFFQSFLKTLDASAQPVKEILI